MRVEYDEYGSWAGSNKAQVFMMSLQLLKLSWNSHLKST